MAFGSTKSLATILLGTALLGGCKEGRDMSSSGYNNGDAGVSFIFRTLGGLSSNPNRALLGNTLSYSIDRESDRRQWQSQQGDTVSYTGSNDTPRHPAEVSYTIMGPKDRIISKPGGFSRRDPVYEEMVFCAIKGRKDLNGDGIIDFPNEYVGLSDTFSVNTPITLCFGTAKLIEDMSNMRMVIERSGAKPSIVDSFSGAELENHKGRYGFDSKYNTGIESRKLDPGRYVARWYEGEEEIGEVPFRIVGTK